MPEEPISIFLVDDDEDDRELFEDAINEIHLETRILSYSSGTDFFANVEKGLPFLPRLIFIDLHMPLLSGEECLQRLRQNPKFDQVAIIMYSTIVMDSLTHRLKELGAAMYLQKPSSFLSLLALLEHCIQRALCYSNTEASSAEFIVK